MKLSNLQYTVANNARKRNFGFMLFIITNLHLCNNEFTVELGQNSYSYDKVIIKLLNLDFRYRFNRKTRKAQYEGIVGGVSQSNSYIRFKHDWRSL